MSEPNSRLLRPDRRSMDGIKTLEATRASIAGGFVIAVLLLFVFGSSRNTNPSIGIIHPTAPEITGKVVVVKPAPLVLPAEDPL